MHKPCSWRVIIYLLLYRTDLHTTVHVSGHDRIQRTNSGERGTEREKMEQEISGLIFT